MSSRLVGNDRLGLGTSEIEVFAKKYKETRRNIDGFPRFFPLVGSDAYLLPHNDLFNI